MQCQRDLLNVIQQVIESSSNLRSCLAEFTQQVFICATLIADSDKPLDRTCHLSYCGHQLFLTRWAVESGCNHLQVNTHSTASQMRGETRNGNL